MPRKAQKTHKGLLKRVTVSAGGRVTYKQPFTGHLMSGKSGRRRLKLRREGQLVGAFAKRMRRALLAE